MSSLNEMVNKARFKVLKVQLMVLKFGRLQLKLWVFDTRFDFTGATSSKIDLQWLLKMWIRLSTSWHSRNKFQTRQRILPHYSLRCLSDMISKDTGLGVKSRSNKTQLWSLTRTSSIHRLAILSTSENRRSQVWPFWWVGPETCCSKLKVSHCSWDFSLVISWLILK